MRLSALLIFLVILLSSAMSSASTPQKKYTPVGPGRWGGIGVEFVVSKSAVAIEYDCATGEISQPFKVDRHGNFVVEGLHKHSPPGPVRLNFQPKPQPVRYEGRISGKTIHFKIVVIQTGDVIGEFTAERGKDARLRKCR